MERTGRWARVVGGGVVAASVLAGLLVACSAAAPGGLEVLIDTNLPTSMYDGLRISVAQATGPGSFPTTPQTSIPFIPLCSFMAGGDCVTMPARLPIQAGTSSDQGVQITVAALSGSNPGTAVVTTSAQVTVPTDEVEQLTLYLLLSCGNCASGETCTATGCAIVTDPQLVAYSGDGGVAGFDGGSSGPDVMTGHPSDAMVRTPDVSTSCVTPPCPAGEDCCGPTFACCPGQGCEATSGSGTLSCTCGADNMYECSGSTGIDATPACTPVDKGCGTGLPCCPSQGCGSGGLSCICGAGNVYECNTPATDSGSCLSMTCAEQNIQCGPAGDGCGGTLECGACIDGQTCGGGGQPGICGGGTATCSASSCPGCCTAAGGCSAGDSSSACGIGGEPCDVCTGTDSCSGGVCAGSGCPTGMSLCASGCVDTESDPNNCGACGKVCPAGDQCLGGGCTCEPQSCLELGYACGTPIGNCGNRLSCGSCAPPETCTAAYQCSG